MSRARTELQGPGSDARQKCISYETPWSHIAALGGIDTQSVSSTASFVSSTASSVADNLICKKSWCLKIIIKETGGRSGIGAAEVIVNSPDNSRIFGHH